MEKLRNINHFWDRWRKEYLINLRECQKILMEDDNRQVISVGDVVMTEEDKVSRFCWRMGLVEKLILWKRWRRKGSSCESFQNTPGNIKTSKQTVPN